jgi:hypothetical protein
MEILCSVRVFGMKLILFLLDEMVVFGQERFLDFLDMVFECHDFLGIYYFLQRHDEFIHRKRLIILHRDFSRRLSSSLSSALAWAMAVTASSIGF